MLLVFASSSALLLVLVLAPDTLHESIHVDFHVYWISVMIIVDIVYSLALMMKKDEVIKLSNEKRRKGKSEVEMKRGERSKKMGSCVVWFCVFNKSD